MVSALLYMANTFVFAIGEKPIVRAAVSVSPCSSTNFSVRTIFDCIEKKIKYQETQEGQNHQMQLNKANFMNSLSRSCFFFSSNLESYILHT